MERHEMETRLRQTLAERADDVIPSPELWERVADATVRRSRWRSPAVWGGLAAAAAAIVVAVTVVPGLLDTPPTVDIADEPPPAGSTTPTETDAGPVVGTEGVRVIVGRGGENAIGGQGALVEVDPATGEDERVLAEGQPGIDAPAYTSVDLRPGGSGELAAMVTVEGQWDIRLLEADGSLEQAFVADPTFEEGEEHHLAWSQDGAYLAWTSTPDDGDGAIIRLLDVDAWRSSPVVDDPFGARAFAQAFELEQLATMTTELFDVVGVRGAELTVLTSTGDLLLAPTDGCASNDCTYIETDLLPLFPVDRRIDVADSDRNPGVAVGPQYLLVDRTTPDGEVNLVLGGDGDQGLDLELPEAAARADASIDSAWLAASGERVLVGRGGRAWLLTVDLDAATPRVVDTVELAGGGDVATGAVAVDRQPGTGEDDLPDDRTPTAPDGQPDTAPSGPDAVATSDVVVTPDAATGGFVLTGPDFGTVTVPKPDELLEEEVLTSVAVRPGAADGDVEVVSGWFVGDSAIRVLTVVRDGEVVRNEPLPGEQQSRGGGGIAETPDDTPMFSPGGDHLLWLEGSASAGELGLAVQRWDADGPRSGSAPTPAGAAERAFVPLPVEDGVTGFRVEAVARDDRGIVVFASTWQPGPEADRTASMLRITLPTGIEGGVVADQAVVTRIELPGVLVGGGVTGTGDLDDAVGLVETEGGLLLVGLRDPRELVELDTADLAELDPAFGLLAAVTGDGAVLRLADGGFRLVTLAGDPRELDLPRGTLTVG